MEARSEFERLAVLPDSQIPLAEGALWIAAESKPGTDVADSLAKLQTLAEDLRPRIESCLSARAKIDLLNRALFHEEGFKGNEGDYSSPSNSYLDAVLESRQGIPITLSILYLDIAERLGLECQGVGFPGHFLVKAYAEEGEIIVDPFVGRTIEIADCKARLARATGQKLAFHPRMLNPTPSKGILQRVLRNLKLIHLAKKEFEAALGCSERILLLAGDDLSELRDRALIYRELECTGPALADLERYLAYAPNDPQSAALGQIARDLAEKVRVLH